MNKKQRIALIIGGIMLAIVLLTTRYYDIGRGKYSYDTRVAFVNGGVVTALTFVAYIALKSKD